MDAWKVGEVARRTGISVRTLHYYEEIGLLVPSRRTRSGHRLYGPKDVERLYRIRALAALGLSLDEVRAPLARPEESSPLALVERQLARVEARIALEQRLRERLLALRSALHAGAAPSSEEFLRTIEVMTMIEKYYTKEQLETLAKRREELGEEAIAQAQKEWPELIAAMRAHADRGTDPADPEVQALARRWRELIEAFTGGDPGIRRSLETMYANEPGMREQAGIDAALMQYVQRAWEAGA
ncbi:MAG TPA: MerR family transcriptional regulator [Sandaracinaceae bacterium]